MFLTTALLLVCPFGSLGAEASSATALGGSPICDAGGPYYAECQNGVASVTLDGSGSYDPSGAPLRFFWRIECGQAVLTNANTPEPTVSYELNGLCETQCGRVDLLVLNPETGAYSICHTSIYFADSEPPAITCPPDVVLGPGDPTDPGSTGVATADDACNGPVATTWSDEVSVGPNGETIITRTWSAADGCGESTCEQTITIEEPPPPGAPGLDIKPTSCPNPINVGSNGVIPVALTGAAGFDVGQVDATTLVLARHDGVGAGIAPNPSKLSIADTATPFAGTLCDCHTLGADGFLDLNMKFDKQATEAALQLGTVPSGTYLQLDLTGKLLDGTSFTVSDCIRVQ